MTFAVDERQKKVESEWRSKFLSVRVSRRKQVVCLEKTKKEPLVHQSAQTQRVSPSPLFEIGRRRMPFVHHFCSVRKTLIINENFSDWCLISTTSEATNSNRLRINFHRAKADNNCSSSLSLLSKQTERDQFSTCTIFLFSPFRASQREKEEKKSVDSSDVLLLEQIFEKEKFY